MVVDKVAVVVILVFLVYFLMECDGILGTRRGPIWLLLEIVDGWVVGGGGRDVVVRGGVGGGAVIGSRSMSLGLMEKGGGKGQWSLVWMKG